MAYTRGQEGTSAAGEQQDTLAGTLPIQIAPKKKPGRGKGQGRGRGARGKTGTQKADEESGGNEDGNGNADDERAEMSGNAAHAQERRRTSREERQAKEQLTNAELVLKHMREKQRKLGEPSLQGRIFTDDEVTEAWAL